MNGGTITRYAKSLETWAAKRLGISQVTLWMTVFLLFSAVVFTQIIVNVPGGMTSRSIRRTLWEFAVGFPEGQDSWYPMTRAYDHATDQRPGTLYDTLLFGEGLKLQYPPSSLLALELLAKWDPRPIASGGHYHVFYAACEHTWVPTLDLVGWYATIVLIGCAAYLFIESARRHRFGGIHQRWSNSLDVLIPPAAFALIYPVAWEMQLYTGWQLDWIIPPMLAVAFAAILWRWGADRAVLSVVLLVLGLTCYPAIKAYTIGQLQSYINALFALALVAWWRDKRATAGVFIGIACLLKPQLGVFLIWALIRREWTFAAALSITVGLGESISLAMYGWENHASYLKALSFLAQRGEGFYPNNSINGLLNRLLFNGNNVNWSGKEFPPYHPIVYWGTLLSSAALIGWALRPRRRKDALPNTYDFAFMGLAATMASPIAWEHHYGILLPIVALAVPRLLVDQSWRRATLPAVCIAYLLGSHLIIATNRFADVPVLNLAQSYLLFSALVFLTMIDTLRRRPPIKPYAEAVTADVDVPLHALPHHAMRMSTISGMSSVVGSTNASPVPSVCPA